MIEAKLDKVLPKNLARMNWTKVFALRKFISLAKVQSSQAPASFVIGGIYQVGKKIANGAFGQLRVGQNLSTHQPIAIKLEHVNAKIPMLLLEFRFYRSLGNYPGLPKVYYYGTCGKYNALVMELLGSNLEEQFVKCHRHFSLKTILLIAIQLLHHIEYVHTYGIIYRDIKPENCMVGRRAIGRHDSVYMVDFGLAKEYIDPDTGRHIPYMENKNLTGTVRYMSINSHHGYEQSRRDDLEALGHVFFYFLTSGCLPWQGMKCNDIRMRYQIIGRLKEETCISELGLNYPWEFSVYLRYCRNLKFAQAPDYAYLRNLFRGCLQRIGCAEDFVYDWMGLRSNQSGISGQALGQDFQDSPRSRRTAWNTNELQPRPQRTSRSYDSIVLSATNDPEKISNQSHGPSAILRMSNQGRSSPTSSTRKRASHPIEESSLEPKGLQGDVDQDMIELMSIGNEASEDPPPAPTLDEATSTIKYSTPIIVIHGSEDDAFDSSGEASKTTPSLSLTAILDRRSGSISLPRPQPKVRPVAKIEPLQKVPHETESSVTEENCPRSEGETETPKEIRANERRMIGNNDAEIVQFDTCCSFSVLTRLFT